MGAYRVKMYNIDFNKGWSSSLSAKSKTEICFSHIDLVYEITVCIHNNSI
uniref:Uncharacterized protein n=1 Tax=Lepeophtheirus salmonis TaxID=72036 RepID=A0A0K2TAR7_LEPSM